MSIIGIGLLILFVIGATSLAHHGPDLIANRRPEDPSDNDPSESEEITRRQNEALEAENRRREEDEEAQANSYSQECAERFWEIDS